MTVWVVGRGYWRLGPDKAWSWTWDLHGIFRRKEDAEALCQNEHWYIAPVMLDKPLPEHPCEFLNMLIPNDTEAEALRCEDLSSASED